jgi:hypothetical protein
MNSRKKRALGVFGALVLVAAVYGGAVMLSHKMERAEKARRLEAEAEVRRLVMEYEQDVDSAKRGTSDNCSGFFFEHLQPPVKLERPETDVIMGHIIVGGSYEYTLRQDGDAIELWFRYGTLQAERVSTMYLPGSKYCTDKGF